MFNYSDPQQAEAIAWLTLFLVICATGAVGCVLHGLHREYRQYLNYRRTHARWREICEGDDRGSL
jgi:hypothetical protein